MAVPQTHLSFSSTASSSSSEPYNNKPQNMDPTITKDTPPQRRWTRITLCLDLALVIFLSIWLKLAITNNPTHYYLPAYIIGYSSLMLYILTKYITSAQLIRPFTVLFHPICIQSRRVPDNCYAVVFALLTLSISIVMIMITPDSDIGNKMERTRSLLGVLMIILGTWALSNNRNAVDYRLVSIGILAQFGLGLFVIKTHIGYSMFHYMSELVARFLSLGKVYGLELMWPNSSTISNFTVDVLSAVIFFTAFIQVAYYLGLMQWLIVKIAWLMVRLMNTSGSESVVAVASPFVGQGESALLVLPFIEHMTDSEIHTIMTSGFSTIAGTVFLAYIGLGIQGSSLITACVMSVPCSLALSKLRWPETESSLTKGTISIMIQDQKEANVIHAAANGAAQGITLAALIAGSLISIIALYHFVDNIFITFWSFLNFEQEISIKLVLGYVFWIVAWFMGVPLVDCAKVGRLLGMKMVVNEFHAFNELSNLLALHHDPNLPPREISKRGELLASIALCGFANVVSIGIQIACLGAMAPSRRYSIAKMAVPAMLMGFVCSVFSAAIIGILA